MAIVVILALKLTTAKYSKGMNIIPLKNTVQKYTIPVLHKSKRSETNIALNKKRYAKPGTKKVAAHPDTASKTDITRITRRISLFLSNRFMYIDARTMTTSIIHTLAIVTSLL